MLSGCVVTAGLCLALLAVLYNRLVRDRNRVDAAWSDIDVQLQRRHDLVPQLVAAVRQYAAYERATLEAVTELRDQAAATPGVAVRGELEERLGAGTRKLIAVAESYPDLKASGNFLQLQRQLIETENYLQFARRYYNGAVRALNTREAADLCRAQADGRDGRLSRVSANGGERRIEPAQSAG